MLSNSSGLACKVSSEPTSIFHLEQSSSRCGASLRHLFVLTSAFLPVFQVLLVHLIAVQPDAFEHSKGNGAVAGYCQDTSVGAAI